MTLALELKYWEKPTQNMDTSKKQLNNDRLFLKKNNFFLNNKT